MGITGKTINKLFRVRTYNPQNLYQVGVNGVTDITLNDEDFYTITYVLDDITYKTNVNTLVDENALETDSRPSTSIFNYQTLKFSKVNLFDATEPTTNELGSRFIGGSGIADTTYEIDGFSFDQFTENRIVKKEELVGLIDKPITESELFIERDEFAIFERHQRISEISNLADLINYRNGYYEIVNTL